MNAIWIPAETSPGQFSNERAVSLSTADGAQVSFFIDDTLVHGAGSTAKIKVTLVETNLEQRRQRVLLPTETFETQTRWVEVSTC